MCLRNLVNCGSLFGHQHKNVSSRVGIVPASNSNLDCSASPAPLADSISIIGNVVLVCTGHSEAPYLAGVFDYVGAYVHKISPHKIFPHKKIFSRLVTLTIYMLLHIKIGKSLILYVIAC